jgi:predicted ribosome quality control (RQC) complex YloA/Tae2 family protein
MSVIKATAQDISANTYSPIVVYSNEKKTITDCYCFDLSVYKNISEFTVKKYPLYIDALSDHLNLKNKRAVFIQASDVVRKSVSAHLAKAEKKLLIYNNNLSDREKIDKYKLYGELLTANIHAIKQKTDYVELLDYYTDKIVKIPLDQSEDALKNAQSYYKKYKKGIAAYNYAVNAVKGIKKEIEYLKSVLASLELCENLSDIEDIKKELVLEGYMKEKLKIKKGRKVSQPEAVSFNPVKYRSKEGYEIYVGRNNTENDKLTFDYAQNFDIWLHVKNLHGSHVIIKNPAKCEEFVADKTLTEAAVIAAYHSEARTSGQVAVDYTFIKNVKKPKGAKPGYVNYYNYYSAYVKADEMVAKKLRE